MEAAAALDAGTVRLLRPDPALAGWLGVALPGHAILAEEFELAAWLRAAADPQLAGVVLDSEALALADLRTVLASLQRERRPWLLALSGDRGLAGCEALLAAPRTVVLPKPWTPEGVAIALRRLAGPPAAHTRR